MAFIVDGFSTTIILGTAPAAVIFIEKTVQPPALDGGGKIDASGMRNSRLRTFSPKSLATLDDMKLVVFYDPLWFSATGLAAIQLNQYITVRFPDASGFAQYGWIEKFAPHDHKEGDDATADIMICWSNMNSGGTETTLTRLTGIAIPTLRVPGCSNSPGIK